ncbi:MAG: winged helix DNA-binding domain-containing protein [Synergistaceae bacterium]|jgi:hypothetical protein|nr:winged helix DNA-binding domain-containing protein [Synergistaceae bacterium]
MIIDEERLLCARLKNQFLLDRAPCATVVSELCGLQAQFANNPKYALRIRGGDFDEADWNRGLVKTWSFRHTLHTVRLDELGLFLSARGIPSKWEADWNIEGRRMEALAGFLLEQINSGVSGREALRAKCREVGIGGEELANIFHGWGGLFYEMSRRGMIAYHPGTAKNFVPCVGVEYMDRDQARAILLRRYFRRFGPATLEDCAAFTGYKKREIAGVVEKHGIALRSAMLGNTEYFYLSRLPASCEIPHCLFLAGFDQMIMGYRDRSPILDEKSRRQTITVSGIVNPTVLLRGRVCAKWKKDGAKLVISPFTKIPKKDRNAIAALGEHLFGDTAEGGVVFDDGQKQP